MNNIDSAWPITAKLDVNFIDILKLKLRKVGVMLINNNNNNKYVKYFMV